MRISVMMVNPSFVNPFTPFITCEKASEKKDKRVLKKLVTSFNYNEMKTCIVESYP